MVSGRCGLLSDVKGGNGLEALSFSSRLFSLVYRVNREKRGKECSFSTDSFLVEVKTIWEGFRCFAWGFFSPLRSVVNASLKIFLSLGCSTGCCSLQYFHRENTQRISHQSLFFFLFLLFWFSF